MRNLKLCKKRSGNIKKLSLELNGEKCVIKQNNPTATALHLAVERLTIKKKIYLT